MVVLEPFSPDDYNNLIHWIDSPDLLLQFAGPAFSFPLTTQQLAAEENLPHRYRFKAVEKTQGRTIGHGEVHLAEMGCYLARILVGPTGLRGKGYVKQLVQLLANFSFRELHQPFIQLNVFTHNVAAIRCYESLGFVANPANRFERTLNGAQCTGIKMTLQQPQL